MPFDCHVHPDLERGVLMLNGVIDGAVFVQAMDALYRHADWQPGFSALWDARGIRELLIGPEDVARVMEAMTRLEPLMGEGRGAFVVPREIDYVIARLLIHRGASSKRERRTFSRIEAALAWLDEMDAASSMRAAG